MGRVRHGSGSVFSRLFYILVFMAFLLGSEGTEVSALVLEAESCAAEAQAADTVIFNGVVFTSNSRRPLAEALAIRNGRIAHVGSNGGALTRVGPYTRVIDAHGGFITPGFIDSHTHAVWLGILGPVLGYTYSATNLEELKTQVQTYARQNPDLPFVLAIGWKYDYIPGGIPTLAMADEILPDRDLILWSHDGHTGWVNSRALQRMQTSNPAAFRHLTPVLDPKTQKPTGIFLHFYAINPFDFYSLEELGPDVPSKMADSLKKMLGRGLAVGVTAHHDVMIHRTVFPLLKKMDDLGCFENARVRGAYFVNHYDFEDEEALLKNLKFWKQFGIDHSTDHLYLGQSIKLGIDGVASNHTGFLKKPYCDRPNYYGVPSYSAQDFNRLVVLLDGMRFQICTHATGDAGITRVINGYANAVAVNGSWDSRHTIEHNSIIVGPDMPRMRELGIIGSMQPTHSFAQKIVLKTLGPKRADRFNRFRSLERAGVQLAFGSDYSIVPINPVYGLFAASTRINDQGLPSTPAQLKEVISAGNAIRHYTLGGARALKLDREIGSLEVGKKADLVVFSVDLREINTVRFLLAYGFNPEAWDRFVEMTLVDGRIVYRKEGSSF